jgi:hypothetical protein
LPWWPRSRNVGTVAQIATVVPRSSPAGTLVLFNNSVRTAKKTQHFTITKLNLLILFEEIIAVYTENHTKYKKVQISDCQAGGADIYH